MIVNARYRQFYFISNLSVVSALFVLSGQPWLILTGIAAFSLIVLWKFGIDKGLESRLSDPRNRLIYLYAMPMGGALIALGLITQVLQLSPVITVGLAITAAFLNLHFVMHLPKQK